MLFIFGDIDKEENNNKRISLCQSYEKSKNNFFEKYKLTS